MKDQLIAILEEQKGNPISGQEIADRFQVSRNAVWKWIRELRNEGIPVQAKRRSGYYLAPDALYLSVGQIREALPEKLKNLPVTVFPVIDSTNSEALRRMREKDCPDQLIAAARQTSGRGHNASRFYSPEKNGVYMTLIYHPAANSGRVHTFSMRTAAAIAEVLSRETDQKISIGVRNDILSNGKKACGILTEGISDFETEKSECFAAGIGINLGTEGLPETVRENAGWIRLRDPNRNLLIARIVTSLYQFYEDPDAYSRVYQKFKISD